jgi:hypothetical protein
LNGNLLRRSSGSRTSSRRFSEASWSKVICSGKHSKTPGEVDLVRGGKVKLLERALAEASGGDLLWQDHVKL